MNPFIEDGFKYRRGRITARQDHKDDGVEHERRYLPDTEEDRGYRAEWRKIHQEIEQSSRVN